MAKYEKAVKGLNEVCTWFDLAGMKKLRNKAYDGLTMLMRQDAGGYWIDVTAPDGPEEYRCSICSYEIETVKSPKELEMLFCPHCGTRLGW